MSPDLSYLLGSLGISLLLGLSACGSCSGMSRCGAAAAMHSDAPAIVTYSYVSMIIISTVFFYAFILAIIIINKLAPPYTLHDGLKHLMSGLLFGSVGFSTGTSMGLFSERGFRHLAKKSEFFVIYLLGLATMEVTLVIAFLCTLLTIYSK